MFGTIDLLHFAVSTDASQLRNLMALRNILSILEISISFSHIHVSAKF
jgi:hypothetical protein